MIKKSLLLMLLMALLAPWAAKAQEIVTIGDGTATSNTNPIGTYYNYSITEQLYTADEIGMAGTISSISFYYKGNAAKTLPITVYMKHVDEENLASAGISLADADEVFSGTLSVTTTAGWVTIDLDTPFAYDGTSNLLIGCIKDYLYYFSGQTWQGTAQTSTMARYTQNDNNAYTTSTIPGTAQTNRPNIQIAIIPAGGGCDMPTEITVSNITTDGAQVTWKGDGSAWNLRYKASTDADYTLIEGLTSMSYDLSGLTANTAYSVGAQTVCTGSTSSFRSTSFTTANPCAAPTNLQITNVTASSAELSWTAGYQETNWKVKYKKSSETDWTEENVDGTPTITLTGLAGLTTYNVQVYNCENYVSGNFTTATSFPYAQDFSGSGIPTGWTQWSGLLEEVMTGTALTSTTYGWSNGTNNGVLDGNNIYANIYGTSRKNWIVTPAIPMPAGARITFDVAYTAYSGTAVAPAQDGDDDKFVVLASTDNMATWTILRQWDNAGSTYVLNDLTPATLSLNFDMAAYAGTNLNIAFYAESTVNNADNNIHVDNVVFELVPSCEKPTNLTVNYTGGTTATVSFNSDASAWNLDVNGTITAINENPYTLEGLELAKTYEVKVQANCGGSTSEWTNAVSFNTDMCMPADQCELTFLLTDSYGDGWNGAYIDVVDVATNTSLGHMTNQNLNGTTGNGTNELNTLTLAVCDGRELQFVWHAGSFDSECSYVVNDVNGEEIFSGSGTMSTPVNYTVNCTLTNCKKPTDLAASEIGPHSVKLSWTENGEATAWVVAYSEDGTTFDEVDAAAKPYTLTGLDPETDYLVKVRPICSDFDDKWSDEIIVTTTEACPAPTIGTITTTPFTATVEWTGFSNSYELEYSVYDYTPSSTALWLQYDNGTLQTNVGNATVYTWQWGVMYPADSLHGQSYLNKVAFYESSYYIADAPITISIYSGGDTEPGTLLYEENATCLGVVGVHEVTLQQPVAIDPTENLWIVLTTTTIDRPMAMCNVDEANGRWLNNGGNWIDIGSSLTSVSTYSWMIRGFIDSKAPTYNWTTVSDATSPFTISGLQAETDYVVRVKGDCGTDGESEWANASFTTASACDAPFDLAATEVLITDATLTWDAYQEDFNARYAKVLYTDFDDSDMNGWTNIDADGDGYEWVLGSATGGVYLVAGGSLAGSGHNASADLIVSGSYSNVSGVGALEPDNYLVSPQVALGGAISFWACAQDATYAAEHFGVAVSTTGNTDAADFTTIQEWTMTAKGTGAKANPGTTRSGNRGQGNWYQFTVDLSAYAGQTGYVAIRHFNCTDQFMLDVDDIAISEPWITITGLNAKVVTINSLEVETTYAFQVQGINPKCDPSGLTDWSDSFIFSTLANEPIAILDGGDWDQNSTWINSGGVVPPAGTDVYISGDVVIPAGYTAVAGEITIVNGGSLTIEEGGELQHTEEVELTMNLNIGGYSKENPSGYNLIAAPTYTTTYYSLPVEGTQLNTGTFDLYYFDQNYDGAEWRNYKVSTNYFTDLNLAQGYLYANQGGADIKFTGFTYPTDEFYGVDLYFVDGKPFEGLNLLGNPYTCTTYINSSKTNSGSTAKPFFVLEGTTFVAKNAGEPIAPLKGIFVEATATTDSVFFFTTAPSSAKSTLDITVNQGSEMIDNAIIDFNAGSSLTKFQFNPNSTKVYMPVDGKDYAVVSAESEGEMPVCFKAEENGTYTMSFASENTKFNYLHLIDNMTGADVDLLVNPNYTFDARYTDYASRFKLVFATGNNDSESNFGFISDGNLMILGIEGEATLQMIDVTGRILSTETFSGSYNKALNASAGVYMLRLIQGENVRTQKIVVK